MRRNEELRQHLGLLESQTPARHLKMKIGRVTKHANNILPRRGSVAGLHRASPRATALLFIQQTAASLVEFLESGDLSEAAHD